jgi:hypothetical protein
MAHTDAGPALLSLTPILSWVRVLKHARPKHDDAEGTKPSPPRYRVPALDGRHLLVVRATESYLAALHHNTNMPSNICH